MQHFSSLKLDKKIKNDSEFGHNEVSTFTGGEKDHCPSWLFSGVYASYNWDLLVESER